MPIRAKKSLGQNFLTDPLYLDRIVEAARLRPEDRVLEIGPGQGHLTRRLAARAGRVLVIELDDRLVPELRRAFADRPHVEIVHADALHYDYGVLDGAWKVVANLPYYIATPLLERLLAVSGLFTTLTVMLQKEVARRVAAVAGSREYGLLSVLVQLRAEARIEMIVPAGAFTPRPKVDSAVVTLTVSPSLRVVMDDERFFLQVAKAAFGQRRKTLRNSLAALPIPRRDIESAAARAGIDLGRRPETLSLAEFGRLADALRTPVTENQEETESQ